MTTLPLPNPTLPENSQPLEAEEIDAALRRSLSVSEAVIVLMDECPRVTNAVLAEFDSVALHAGKPGVRSRRCVLSVPMSATQRQCLQGADWHEVLNEARAQFGSEKP